MITFILFFIRMINLNIEFNMHGKKKKEDKLKIILVNEENK